MNTKYLCTECSERISKTNVRALNKTLRALTLNDEHAAMVAHAKTLATLIDSYPYEAKMHAEYREALKRLLEAGSPEESDAFDELLTRLNETDDSVRIEK